MGSYYMPLKDLQIIMASFLSDADKEQICNAFFPGLNTNLKALDNILFRPLEDLKSADATKAIDATNDISAYARMPYNIVANSHISPAVGTQALPKDKCHLWKLERQWDMWPTASRSCVIRLDSIGGKEDFPASQNIQTSSIQHVNASDETISIIPWISSIPNPLFQANDVKPAFKLENMYVGQDKCPKYFSVKTGVCYASHVTRTSQMMASKGVWYVGKSEQATKESGDKGTLDKDAISAALRSEWINVLGNNMKDPAKDKTKDLIILPEVLTGDHLSSH
jgi:hypothetical protein